ncbi:hypothetical protein [Thalassotalea sp. ND16A]|uniref:hypothetical protein n=1 Tax=Thalassotalea sp. ND16A TaxID=1535422 RepID=UPI00051A53DC|nr:hypothetical protein [Thalassotalea sp. ND16A]KGJ99170.1 hypothetical protein ND16A_3934 [Thalassotalea sp. ND16A]
MNTKQLAQFRLYFTGAVTIIILALLAWQFSHDGVPSHHLLQRADLPAISNWWGALLLPTLSWVLIGRINNRVTLQNSTEKQSKNEQLQYPAAIKLGFITALIYGALLSILFVTGHTEISGILFFGIVSIAIFFKVYREECVLAFILGMSVVFGAILPTIFAIIISLASALVYHSLRFVWARMSSLFLRANKS